MSCCDDPTEPHKIDSRDVIREQEHYGNLVRDLFTDDPEKVILKLLKESTTYLRELAALRAHYPSVRLKAIELLDKNSKAVLDQIIEKEPDSPFVVAARKQSDDLDHEQGLLGKLFNR
ncbi:hypothetical protein [Methylicorpusculum sp.]|uniref:hypothetical protein n=1 Tax=Methylicorpusculum sp. TaxID=2713644 RepID=UPI00273550EA|nr:hypothetical protein [Methylicorpusculum sp.]MDP3528564.1 hypothetical protein [Methylicorpusculum sp.]MDZ4154330.1 hypothetical protein [Methylicorpusculum sp.]